MQYFNKVNICDESILIGKTNILTSVNIWRCQTRRSFPKVHHRPTKKQLYIDLPLSITKTIRISAFKNTFTHHQRLETQWWKLDRTQSASLGGQSSPLGGQSAYLEAKARTWGKKLTTAKRTSLLGSLGSSNHTPSLPNRALVLYQNSLKVSNLMDVTWPT